MTWQTINPASGAVVASYEETSPEAVQAIIASAHRAYLEWRQTSFRERAGLMRRAADVLRGNAREYARLMAEEMGKPIRDGIAEIQKCAGGCDFYAENAERFLAPEPVATEARKSFIAFNPLGVVLGRHAMEFPVLAGVPLRCARSYGRQRRRAETCIQCARVRPCNRTGLPQGRLPRAFVPNAFDRQ